VGHVLGHNSTTQRRESQGGGVQGILSWKTRRRRPYVSEPFSTFGADIDAETDNIAVDKYGIHIPGVTGGLIEKEVSSVSVIDIFVYSC
jgi:hypothetical protein